MGSVPGPAPRAVLLDAPHAIPRGAAGQSVPANQGRRRALPLAGPGGVRRRLCLRPPSRGRSLSAHPQSRLHAGERAPPRSRSCGSTWPRAIHPTRGRELNIHFGDVEDRNFIGQISHLGDMVPVMAGVTLSFKMRERAAGRAGLRRRRRDLDRCLSRRHQLRGRATLSTGRDRGKQRLRLLHAHVRAVRR